MSKNSELQELVLALQTEVGSLEVELENLKKKQARKIKDFKARLQAQARLVEDERDAGYQEAAEAMDSLKERVKKLAKGLREEDLSLLGLTAQNVINGKLDLLEELFGDV